jgi:signal transduction histidine kinase
MLTRDVAVLRTLAHIPLFADFTEDQLSALVQRGSTVEVDGGQTLIRRGERGDSLYVVLDGTLGVHTEDDRGGRLDLRTLARGDWFGEVALLDGGPRSASVDSLTACRLLCIDRDVFMGLLLEHRELLSLVLANLTGTVRANTQRIQAEEARQATLRTEMELERYRGLAQMVAGVAHELNTPIGTANTAASIVKSRAERLSVPGADSGVRDTLDDLRAATDLLTANLARAHTLIQRFKTLSVAETVDVLETLDLPTVVADIVCLFAITARQAHLEIRVLSELPESSAAWVGYRGYLTQVVLNLLTNVERYAYPDGIGGVVEMRLAQVAAGQQPSFVLEVRDYGLGMAADTVSRVFDPFFTTGRSRGGSGLGLAIVHTIVTSVLNGTIDVSSAPGQGTTVRVAFPKRLTPDIQGDDAHVVIRP